MDSLTSIFFELLQVAVCNRHKLSRTLSEEEWLSLYDMAKKQSLTGIAFCGVEKLPAEQRPERRTILRWANQTQKIEHKNVLKTKMCQQLCEVLGNQHYASCILKGQANHYYYGPSLGLRRSSGDIDVWVAPADPATPHPVKTVVELFSKKDNMASLCYLHVELKPIGGVPIEVHLRPSFMNDPVRNHRFLAWFGHGSTGFDKCVCKKTVADGITVNALDTDYDVVFQLNHIYRHLIDEGIGLRQVLDFYMLLTTWHREGKMSAETLMVQLKRFGMKRIAGALMYVLHEVFAMPEDCMLCPMSEKDGRFLLEEIMTAGNFGHGDPRLAALEVKKGKTSYQVKHAWRRFTRNLRFFTSYPGEVLWEPVVRVIHFLWRKFRLWRF